MLYVISTFLAGTLAIAWFVCAFVTFNVVYLHCLLSRFRCIQLPEASAYDIIEYCQLSCCCYCW